MPTVLIGSGPLRSQPGPFRDLLGAAKFQTLDPPGDHTLTEAELRPVLPETDAIIAGGELLTADLIARAPRLRVIARTGVGFDSVDVEAATARGIVVTITPGTNQESVAEQAFALLLALTRHVVPLHCAIQVGGWGRKLPRPLRGQTLGLIGLGRIGRAMATRSRAFGMDVVAFDLLSDAVFDAQHGIRRVSLEELLAVSDVVSLHLPLTEATAGLINRETLARMKPGAILINTARGGLIVEPDLVESLRSGHLAGAGLDVLGLEPPEPSNPLLQLPNVVFSPHIGGIDTKSMADMAEMAARNVITLRRGEWPAACVVNPALADGWRW